MNGLGQFFDTVFKRPLVAWAALSLASGTGLIAARVAPQVLGLQSSYEQLFVLSCFSLLLISGAFLVANAVAAIGQRIRQKAEAASAKSQLMRKIGELSPDARAVLFTMIINNTPSIWLMNDFDSAHELRVIGFVQMKEVFNGACNYVFDPVIFSQLQKRLAELTEYAPLGGYSDKVRESGALASKAIERHWMAH